MNFGYKWVLLLAFCSVAAHGAAQNTEESVVTPPEMRVGPPPKRGAPPVQQVKQEDPTLNKGKVEWSSRIIEFGTVLHGIPQTKELKVKNTSTESFRILEAKSSCHCTKLEWPQHAVNPGETATILVTHTAEDPGEFYRIISIQTSFDPVNWVMIPVSGVVQVKE